MRIRLFSTVSTSCICLPTEGNVRIGYSVTDDHKTAGDDPVPSDQPGGDGAQDQSQKLTGTAVSWQPDWGRWSVEDFPA